MEKRRSRENSEENDRATTRKNVGEWVRMDGVKAREKVVIMPTSGIMSERDKAKS